MIALVLGIVGLVVVGRLVASRKRVSGAATMFTVAAALSGIAFSCQVFPQLIDRLTHVVNFSDIFHHTVSLIIMALSLLYVETLAPPYVVRRKSVQLSLLITVVLEGSVWAQWLALPARSHESAGDAAGWQGLTGPFAAVTVIYNAYIIGGFAILSWKAIFGAREWFGDVPLLRRASAIMGYGLVLMGISQTVLFVRLLIPNEYQALTSNYWVLVLLQTIIFTVGLLGPGPASAFVKIRVQRMQIVTLDPLWRYVTTVFPDAQLHARRRVGGRMTAVATTRRFIEIGDCLSRLVLPIAAVNQILDERSPAEALGRFLVSFEPKELSMESGEPALSLLPTLISPDADREQLLVVAQAFNEGRSSPRVHRCSYFDLK